MPTLPVFFALRSLHCRRQECWSCVQDVDFCVMAIVCVTSWKTTKTILPSKTSARGAAGHLSNWHLHSHLDTEILEWFYVTEGTHATIFHNRLQPTITIMWQQFTTVLLLTATTFVPLPMTTSQTSLQIHLDLLQDSPLEMFNYSCHNARTRTHASYIANRISTSCTIKILSPFPSYGVKSDAPTVSMFDARNHDSTVRNHDFIDQRYLRRK